MLVTVNVAEGTEIESAYLSVFLFCFVFGFSSFPFPFWMGGWAFENVNLRVLSNRWNFVLSFLSLLGWEENYQNEHNGKSNW